MLYRVHLVNKDEVKWVMNEDVNLDIGMHKYLYGCCYNYYISW